MIIQLSVAPTITQLPQTLNPKSLKHLEDFASELSESMPCLSDPPLLFGRLWLGLAFASHTNTQIVVLQVPNSTASRVLGT